MLPAITAKDSQRNNSLSTAEVEAEVQQQEEEEQQRHSHITKLVHQHHRHSWQQTHSAFCVSLLRQTPQ